MAIGPARRNLVERREKLLQKRLKSSVLVEDYICCGQGVLYS